MKNTTSLFIATLIVLTLCLGCSVFGDEYDHLGNVEQSGEMICVVKERYSAEYKVRKPLSKGELFLRGWPYKSEEFPKITVRECSSVSENMISIKADEGTFLWIDEEGDYKLKKLSISAGDLSNDLKWFVESDKRINIFTSEEITFKSKLPSSFLGNSPDWKTIITEGENLVEKDRISIHILDVETGASKEYFLRRSNYLFMLNRAHQLAGVVSNNLWISNQFRWLPDKDGKYQLVYPVLEKDEIKK